MPWLRIRMRLPELAPLRLRLCKTPSLSLTTKSKELAASAQQAQQNAQNQNPQNQQNQQNQNQNQQNQNQQKSR